MDQFEEKLNQIISNPESMAQILSMAQTLAGTQEHAPQNSESTTPAFDVSQINSIVGLMKNAGQTDKKQQALFEALKPFMSPKHRERLDRAMQIAKMSQLAGYALRGYNMPENPQEE